MNERQARLMRALTAAQAALFDVIDVPSGPGAKAARTILGILIGHVEEAWRDLNNGDNDEK